MSGEFLLEVVTPEKLVLSRLVEYVGVPGILGEFGVLANHIPFLSALGIGSLFYKAGGETRYIFVSGGFAEISNAKTVILTEAAELPEDIDVDRAQRARERALQRLEGERRERLDYARAQSALQRALMRMKTRENAKM